MKIVVYSDQQAKTAVSALGPALRDTFPREQIVSVDTGGFLQTLSSGTTDVAIIPGICGEESRYFDLLGGDSGQDLLRNYVENGGILVTICAGSYLVASLTEYVPPWGNRKERLNPRALFNAVARGPLAWLSANPENSDEWYSDCTVVPVVFEDTGGKQTETGVVYGLGPALFPLENLPGLEILARYRDAPEQPPAAAFLPVGRGGVVWLGILPHIGWQAVQRNRYTETICDLMDALEPHEEGRQKLWDRIVNKIREQTGKAVPALGPAP